MPSYGRPRIQQQELSARLIGTLFAAQRSLVGSVCFTWASLRRRCVCVGHGLRVEGSGKIWVGYENPCTNEDMDIFYAATKISIGNGLKTCFCHAPWLEGEKPKSIAPLIFEISSKKKCTVGAAVLRDWSVQNVRLDEEFTIDHLSQFVRLWTLFLDINLNPNIEYEIRWWLTENGEYSAKSTYKMQFMGTISSSMAKTVWRPWAPPKKKIFAWLANQNRIWTPDRLARRGWLNCELCPFCKQTAESVAHLFSIAA